jgi:hypothetical protein
MDVGYIRDLLEDSKYLVCREIGNTLSWRDWREVWG